MVEQNSCKKSRGTPLEASFASHPSHTRNMRFKKASDPGQAFELQNRSTSLAHSLRNKHVTIRTPRVFGAEAKLPAWPLALVFWPLGSSLVALVAVWVWPSAWVYPFLFLPVQPVVRSLSPGQLWKASQSWKVPASFKGCIA